MTFPLAIIVISFSWTLDQLCFYGFKTKKIPTYFKIRSWAVKSVPVICSLLPLWAVFSVDDGVIYFSYFCTSKMLWTPTVLTLTYKRWKGKWNIVDERVSILWYITKELELATLCGFDLIVESNSRLPRFCVTTLGDWLKKRATLSQPIKIKTKTNRDLLVHIFPPFVLLLRVLTYNGLPCFLCDYPEQSLWFGFTSLNWKLL